MSDCQSYRILLFSLLLFSATRVSGQVQLTGRVFDSTGIHPLEAVSVMTSGGKGTVTDKQGRYVIEMRREDSVWFSYLGKETYHYPGSYVLELPSFDLALQVSIPVLQEVKVKPYSYKEDSISNREVYAKIFNYKKPTLLGSVKSISPLGISIDINELIESFNKKKINRTLRFQKRLQQEEKEKFVDHRFNKGLVTRLTGLTGQSLERFMFQYRPLFEFAWLSSDYEFNDYIVRSYRQYQQQNKNGSE